MDNKSKFDTDTIFERTSIEYLRKNNFFEKIGIFNCKFIDDINEQKSGCDLIADIDIDGQILKDKIIDVKSIAGLIPTFSQEIINATSKRVGWIMNNNLNTEYYLYVWHGIDNPEGYEKDKLKIIENTDIITKNRLCLVKKKDVQNLIENETGVKCTPEYAYGILNVVNQITTKRNKTNYYQCKNSSLLELENGRGERVYVTQSNNIHEKPINFIVRERDLKILGKEIVI